MNNTGPDSSPVIQSTPKDPVGLVVYRPHDGLCITTDMSVNHRQSASPGSRRPFRIATALPLNSLHPPIDGRAMQETTRVSHTSFRAEVSCDMP